MFPNPVGAHDKATHSCLIAFQTLENKYKYLYLCTSVLLTASIAFISHALLDLSAHQHTCVRARCARDKDSMYYCIGSKLMTQPHAKCVLWCVSSKRKRIVVRTLAELKAKLTFVIVCVLSLGHLSVWALGSNQPTRLYVYELLFEFGTKQNNMICCECVWHTNISTLMVGKRCWPETNAKQIDSRSRSELGKNTNWHARMLFGCNATIAFIGVNLLSSRQARHHAY